MRLFTALLFASISLGSIAQEKKVIDHTVYNDWKSLKSAQISNDGKFISYEIKPHRGDGVLCIYNVETGETDTIPRAYRAQFSGGSSYIAFKITPGFDTLRTCELKEIKRTKWPKDSLGIYYLGQDSLAKYPKVKSFTTSDENDWMAVQFQHNKLTEVPGKKKKKKKRRRKNKDPEYDSDGKLLWVFHPEYSQEIQNVTGYFMSYEGDHVAYKTHRSMDDIDSVKVNFFSFANRTIWTWKDQYTEVDIQAFNTQENQLAFYATLDTSEVKQYDIHLLAVDGSKHVHLDSAKIGFDIDHSISPYYDLSFTMKDDILFFGVGDRELEEPEDTLTKKEKVHLDLWHYKDQRLQPQQLLEKDDDLQSSWMYAYHINSDKVVQLENDTLDVYQDYNLKGKYLMGSSDEPYAHTYNWVSPRPRDFYRVNIETGEAEMVLTGQKFWPSMSPSGKYMEFYCDGEHHMLDLETGQEDCITCNTADVVWTEDMNGMPMEAYPRDAGYWTRDESKVLIQSKFDFWQYDRNEKTLSSYTHDMGKLNNVELSLGVWERDSAYYEPSNVYFTGFDKTTKGSHYYVKDHDDHHDLVETAYFDARVMQLQRSKNEEHHIVRKMTFQDYPELYTFTDNMAEMSKISTTNPQQDEYKWGTVELTKWTSYDGFELEGLIYKPEDFDSTKSYPLMVYFYELYADRLHSHYIPKPTASIIYATEYASAGYVVFMPDIRYKPGYPAKSAYDCIMSGTDHVLEMYPNVDSTRMALQGQSWGGYQTAQLVTMTNRYRAAMAGAPVANMFSAYGGIRWGSGLNRQFQYERTQSRIGYTIWERPELYVENSPLFHLPNVQTPLMIMHNDADGAVPWYQGIELFTGLKRLGRPAWLLNYNDDKHNLMRNANRIDLSIRMRQFFDHYLLDAPAPQWLTEGIPATVKGKEMRYE